MSQTEQPESLPPEPGVRASRITGTLDLDALLQGVVASFRMSRTPSFQRLKLS